jgi:polyhydroxyalkanoate synthesis regulator protein
LGRRPKAFTISARSYQEIRPSRLYDTVAGRYLTVENLRHWVATGVRFVVMDAETGEDVTRALLA